MKVLITGAFGLLGSRMADWIKTHKPEVEVIGLDDLSGGWRENLREDVPFYQMNLLHTDLEKVFESCPFILVDDYIQNSSDPLNEAYLEIISRGSKVKGLVQVSELENRKIPELLP